MIALPVPAAPVRRHERSTAPVGHPERSAARRAVEGPPASPPSAESTPSLEEPIDASVDAALAEALAKVSTPADGELAKQQQAFDRLMQLRTENEREANAIREFGLAQAKKENDFLNEFIRMI
jgi:hypothetical protein